MNPVDQPLRGAPEAEESSVEVKQKPELRQWVKPDFQRIALNEALTSLTDVGSTDAGTLAS